MIFIGPKLSEPNAHFVTNIIDCIGSDHDLIIDLKNIKTKEFIFNQIQSHIKKNNEKYVIYNAYEDEDFIIDFKKQFSNLILFTFFSDDEWRHNNYDRYVALYSDFFSIAPIDNLNFYSSYGLKNGMICQWACNPQKFYPLKEIKNYDVTFIGAPHSKRAEYIRYLVQNGINVKLFGKGWNKHKDLKKYWNGYLSNFEMIKVINQSKINLNFLWLSRNPKKTTIKGRTMELAACRTFQLSNYIDELNKYGFYEGENICTFNNKQEMLDKVNYYLNNEKEREIIAENSYNLVLKNHTWAKRFSDVFVNIENGKRKNEIPKFKILVLLQKQVEHSITTPDSRMEIHIKKGKDYPEIDFDQYNGIVFLSQNSSINNETLYMMAFARHCDNSDATLANFYICLGGENIWIRVWDRIIESYRKIIRFLPQEAICFSPHMARKFVIQQVPWNKLNLSFIEYPSFTASGIGVFRSRLLGLCFGKYDQKLLFKKSLRRWQFVKAINVGLDHLAQREIRKRAM